MTYMYFCSNCEKHYEVNKSIQDSSREEKCEVCKSVLKRVYESPSVITADGYKK